MLLFKKISIYHLLLLTLVFSACTASKQGEEQQSKPNIIFVITDDQGYGDLACLGNPYIKTPTMDKIHSESVRLTDYHVATTCAPTRSGILTGRNCNRVGVWHTVMSRYFLRKDEKTIADVLVENGYQTAMFGKWHLGENYPYRPQDRGFQEVLAHGGGGIGQQHDHWNNDYFDDTYLHNGVPEKHEGYCTDVWFKHAIKYIEEHKDKPFFCYLSTNAPHGPYHVAQNYIDMYKDNKEIPNPNFYGMITNLDENLAKLENKLEELGIKDNTILVFTTDNGTASGVNIDKAGHVTKGYNAGMRGKKSYEYDGGHRVPFFIRWKNGKLVGGKDITEITSYNDIMPTLLDLCGVDLPENTYDGQSLKPLFEGKAWEERTLITDTQRDNFLEKWKRSAVMTNQWRLIKGKELYDIKKDPGQRIDISSEHPEVVDKLRAAYEKWWEAVSEGSEGYSPILIGGKENPAILRSHDWHTPKLPPWHQQHVRKGYVDNGYWYLDVVKAGKYKVTLMRWPEETGLALNASIKPHKNQGGIDYPKGKKIEFVSAKIKIGEQELETKEIDNSLQGISFDVELNKGEQQLQTWTVDTEGVERGMYYVYLEAL